MAPDRAAVAAARLPVSGHADPGLSDVGRAQAERVRDGEKSRIVVSTHGGFISAYLAHVIGARHVRWFNADCAGISRVIRMAAGRVVVRSVNETGHLEERLSA